MNILLNTACILLVSWALGACSPKPVQLACNKILQWEAPSKDDWKKEIVRHYSKYSDERLVNEILYWNDNIRWRLSGTELERWRDLYNKQGEEARALSHESGSILYKTAIRWLYMKHLWEIFEFGSSVQDLKRQFYLQCSKDRV